MSDPASASPKRVLERLEQYKRDIGSPIPDLLDNLGLVDSDRRRVSMMLVGCDAGTVNILAAAVEDLRAAATGWGE